MTPSRAPFVVRLCIWLVRACSAVVPRRTRREWRMEWEGELHHRGARLASHGTFHWRQQMDLFRRALGAFPDAAWVRRQFTADADIVHDLRHAGRMLAKAPGFTVSAVLILGVGLGSTVAVLTLLDTLLFRPLPYHEAERVMTIWQQEPANPNDHGDVAPANLLDWRDRATSFEALAAAVPYSYDYAGPGEPEVLFGAQVTEGFWEAVGTAPRMGRGFRLEEHVSGGLPVAVISHDLWQRRFGGAADVVGRPLPMDDRVFTIVGVLPADFAPQLLPSPRARDVWVPKVVMDHERRTRGSAWWNVVGRLAPGVSREQAQAEMDRISAALAEEHPRTNAGVRAVVVPLREHLAADVRASLLVMLGAVLLVLSIGCANVGSLVLARGLQREREFAIRSAIGAGRARLVRQLVTESLLLSAFGAAAGLGLAHALVRGIVALAPPGVLRLQDAAIDPRALAAGAGLAALTALAFGLVPALQFSKERSGGMQERTGGAPRGRARQILVVAEVALALTLLAGAGLLIRSFTKLIAVDPGFSPSGVVALQVFAWDRNPTADRIRAFFDATLERLATVPGVQAAGAVSAMPFASANIDIRSPLEVIGRPPDGPEEASSVYVTIATPGYFDAMSVPLREGRVFGPQDRPAAARVAVISESLRRRAWPSEDPIGRRFAIQWNGRRVEAEIVGVVGQIRHESLLDAPRDEVFFPLAQLPSASMTYVLRGAGASAPLIEAAQREIWRVDPLQTFYETMSVERKLEASVVRQRFSVTLMAAFAILALGLCASGIYGVISFTTAQRTREIGVRMALGADRPAIRRMVLREGGWTIGAGLAAGVAGALVAGRSLQSLLFETSPGDPATLAAVSALLAAVGLAACYLPARRATRIDPIAALRDG